MVDKLESKQTGFRFPADLVERLEAYASRIRRQTGMNVSRTQAAISAMNKGLAQEGFPPSDGEPDKGTSSPKPRASRKRHAPKAKR